MRDHINFKSYAIALITRIAMLLVTPHFLGVGQECRMDYAVLFQLL